MGLYEDAQRAKAEADARRKQDTADAEHVRAAQKAQAKADQEALKEFVKEIRRLRIPPAKHLFTTRNDFGVTKRARVKGWGTSGTRGSTPCPGDFRTSCDCSLVVGVDGHAYLVRAQPVSGLFGKEPVPAELPIEDLQVRLVNTLAFHLR